MAREEARAVDPAAGGAGAAVTAAIVTYNSARHLAALRSALLAGSLAPCRMLVVDNSSVDETLPRSRELGFEVLARQRNDGFGAACNDGLRLVDSDYVLFCNPDVRPAADALELLVEALAQEPRAALAAAGGGEGCEPRRFSRVGDSLAGFLPQRLHALLRRGARPVTPARGALAVDYAEGAFILGRTAALRSVGGFDERFFLYHEEEDLCRRLRARGWITLLVPSAFAGHAGGASSEGVGQPAMTAFRLHSLYWYHRRYRSRPYAELARAVVALAVAADHALRKLTRRPQVYARGTALAAFRSIESLRAAHGLAHGGGGR